MPAPTRPPGMQGRRQGGPGPPYNKPLILKTAVFVLNFKL